MTLIELLIVIVIIGILASAVLVAATSLVGKSKTRNTQAVLQIVADAVEQFKREQTEKPTITQNVAYKKRYGLYPPDELEVFSPQGVPKFPSIKSLVSGDPSKITLVPAPQYGPMRFYLDGTADDAKEHRDLAALILAIELHSETARAIMDRIPDRNRSPGVVDASGKPTQFLDRDNNGQFGPEDEQIRYVLDDWGNPISYLSERDCEEGKQDNTRSNNFKDWNEASTELIRLNNGQPVIFSLGPNGKDQSSKDNLQSDPDSSLMGDFEPATPGPNNLKHVIDHPMNADNVYLNQQLRDRLAKGIAG